MSIDEQLVAILIAKQQTVVCLYHWYHDARYGFETCASLMEDSGLTPTKVDSRRLVLWLGDGRAYFLSDPEKAFGLWYNKLLVEDEVPGTPLVHALLCREHPV